MNGVEEEKERVGDYVSILVHYLIFVCFFLVFLDLDEQTSLTEIKPHKSGQISSLDVFKPLFTFMKLHVFPQD